MTVHGQADDAQHEPGEPDRDVGAKKSDYNKVSRLRQKQQRKTQLLL